MATVHVEGTSVGGDSGPWEAFCGTQEKKRRWFLLVAGIVSLIVVIEVPIAGVLCFVALVVYYYFQNRIWINQQLGCGNE